ncbi:MAG: hypothetical protein ACRDRH_08655 [Pseudonocardia sp.]
MQQEYITVTGARENNLRDVSVHVPKRKITAFVGVSGSGKVDQRRLGGGSRSTLGTVTDINPLLRLLLSRRSTLHVGYSNVFGFNDPAGMCLGCNGIGRRVALDQPRSST